MPQATEGGGGFNPRANPPTRISNANSAAQPRSPWCVILSERSESKDLWLLFAILATNAGPHEPNLDGLLSGLGFSHAE